MNYETALEIETAIARHFRYWQNLVVPNCWWASKINLNHEADLIVVTLANIGYEIEIKVSKSDLAADKKKDHHHFSTWINKLFFAMPEKMCRPDCFELIPDDAGILSVNPKGFVLEIRKATVKNKGVHVTDQMKFRIATLGYIRLYHAKAKIIQLQSEVRCMKKLLKEK
jgi:hypothetical protein